MNEFNINEYITLRLENEETVIYINDKRFLVCKYLLINIPIDQKEYFAEMQSIDEVSDTLGKSLEPTLDLNGVPHRRNELPPEVEFWGHCSNLQAWYENNYDTRLLHSNLAFPLLRKLTEVGDPIAKAIFQEEICQRFESFYPSTIKYLLTGGFINFLTEEQKKSLLDIWIEKDIESVFVMLIGNRFLNQFGENYSSLILELFKRHINSREKIYLEVELEVLFEELGITNEEEFIFQLISDERSLLREVFEIRQYSVPTGNELGINYTHLNVFKGLYKFLKELSEEDTVFKTLIVNQVRELFETQSLGVLFSLLRYKFYELLSIEDFKNMVIQEDSPFLKIFFEYLRHEKMMEYFDSSLVPCEFLYIYFNEECRKILAKRIRELRDRTKNQVIEGLTKRIKHKTYHDRIKEFVFMILSEEL